MLEQAAAAWKVQVNGRALVLTLDRVFRRRFRPKQLGFTDDEQERAVAWSDVINNPPRPPSRSRLEVHCTVCQTQEENLNR